MYTYLLDVYLYIGCILIYWMYTYLFDVYLYIRCILIY